MFPGNEQERYYPSKQLKERLETVRRFPGPNINSTASRGYELAFEEFPTEFVAESIFGEHVLDVGCGNRANREARELFRKFGRREYTGVDLKVLDRQFDARERIFNIDALKALLLCGDQSCVAVAGSLFFEVLGLPNCRASRFYLQDLMHELRRVAKVVFVWELSGAAQMAALDAGFHIFSKDEDRNAWFASRPDYHILYPKPEDVCNEEYVQMQESLILRHRFGEVVGYNEHHLIGSPLSFNRALLRAEEDARASSY